MTPSGIHDWAAKRAFLRAAYDETSDKALIVRIADTWVKPEEKLDFVERCYDTFRKWDRGLPKGERSKQLWTWIIQNAGLNVKAPVLWACSIEEFIEHFPPAEVNVAAAVAQLIADPRASLDEDTLARLKQRFVRAHSGDPDVADTLFPRYHVGYSERMHLEGPHTGIAKGHITGSQFYVVPEAATAWSALVDSEGYRMYLECLLSLKSLVGSRAWLRAIEDGRHQVAVMLGGGGSPEKDWVIATSLLRGAKAVHLVITDISQPMLHHSVAPLRRRLAGANLEQRVTLSWDCYDFLLLDQQFVRGQSWQSVVWTLLGGTIGNVRETQFFRSINGRARAGDLLIVGIDTIESTEAEELEARVAAHYRNKELDDLLLTPLRSLGEAPQSVTVTLEGDRRANEHSDVPNSRTAVFSITRDGSRLVLAVSTRYVLQEFLLHAERFGWEHVATEKSGPESTFRQLLFRKRQE